VFIWVYLWFPTELFRPSARKRAAHCDTILLAALHRDRRRPRAGSACTKTLRNVAWLGCPKPVGVPTGIGSAGRPQHFVPNLRLALLRSQGSLRRTQGQLLRNWHRRAGGASHPRGDATNKKTRRIGGL